MSTPYNAPITFTEEKIEHFRHALSDAIIARKDQFIFEDQPFLVCYATYLLKYLEGTSHNLSQRAWASTKKAECPTVRSVCVTL
jgi:hypothetical protein